MRAQSQTFELILTEGFRSTDEIEHLAKMLPLREPVILSRCSAGELPQYAEILGSAIEWLVLGAPAAIFLKSYLSKLGELSAKATVEFLKKKEASEGTGSLIKVAEALALLRASQGENDFVVIGVSLLSDFDGAVLRISSVDPIEIAIQLSAFVCHVEALESAMREEMAAGRVPTGNAVVSVQTDGTLIVEWMDRATTGIHKRKIGSVD